MIAIQPKPNDQMISDAVAAYPRSCHGFFYGIINLEGTIMVTHVTGSAPVQFTGEDLLNAEKIAEENKVSLLGMYVSHPNESSEPDPSEASIAKPGFMYIVIAVSAEASIVTSCWRLNNMMQFEKLEMVNFQYF
jgi:proteasome lid subunit RPN8/RPN11